MLDKCFIKVQVWKPENMPKGTRECPKEVRNFPKRIQKPSQRPRGAHLGPMFLKDMSWNAQLTAKMRPKVAPWRPAASQTPPKWSPKTLPNQIFEHSLGLFVYGCKFACFFSSFVAEFVCFLKSRPLKFMRPRSVLLTSTCLGMFSKKYQKSLKNPPETHPKSKKHRRKIKKNLKKWIAKGKTSEESQKMGSTCEKTAKSDPTWPQDQKRILPRRDTRDPLSIL